MSKESLEHWANGSGADIVEPSSAKQELGWVDAEKPPHSYMNWIQNALFKGLRMLQFGYFFGWIIETIRWNNLTASALVDGGATETDIQEGAVCYLESTGGGAGTNIAVQIVPPSETAGDGLTPTLEMTVADEVVGHNGFVYSKGAAFAGFLDDSIVIMEWQANMDAIGANGVNVQMGLHDSQAATDMEDETSYAFAMFEKLSTDTNWQTRVADGAASTDGDSGTPPVADTWQKFRIEYHGLNTTLGVLNSDPTVRFYIDDTLEAEVHDANCPRSADNGAAGYKCGFVFRVEGDGTGPTADWKLRIGSVRLAFNDYAVTDMPD